jgi:hypothetical protein
MKKSQPLYGTSLFTVGNYNEKSFTDIFYPELSICVISFLRKKGYLVTTRFTLTGYRLITVMKIKTNHTSTDFALIPKLANSAQFIEIQIINSKNQYSKNYKKPIFKSGGIYLFISTLQEFYRLFALSVVEVSNE